MDALTAAEHITRRAYRRRMARSTAARVGVWVVAPVAAWGLILTPVVLASQPTAQPAPVAVPAPVVEVTPEPHSCESLIRWGERMQTAADYMSRAWAYGEEWGEYVETDNLIPLAEQYDIAVAECNGSVTAP